MYQKLRLYRVSEAIYHYLIHENVFWKRCTTIHVTKFTTKGGIKGGRKGRREGRRKGRRGRQRVSSRAGGLYQHTGFTGTLNGRLSISVQLSIYQYTRLFPERTSESVKVPCWERTFSHQHDRCPWNWVHPSPRYQRKIRSVQTLQST